ncbi:MULTISPECIES: ZIP family metal transporter [unclassified Streptomyces]|uniref:ZIP family metal transporter n=1 Tax=unclassified Streptomyces TaxID=2593676 RepID=UPI002E301483|nr:MULTISPECIES: ZIP family metal transporter [unclassified Streptomyces]WUC67012.1 ZIP family metal transporter [Streptomyces sp. NBC_00539]
MAVIVALGAFLMTLAGGWTAQRVTDRRHLVLGLAGGLMLGVVGLDLLPEAMRAAGDEVLGVPLALLLFVTGFLLAHVGERLLAVRQAAHGAENGGPHAAHDGAPRGAGGEAPREHAHRAPEVGLTAAAAMVGHSLADGVALGAAFQVGGGMGVAVALAVVTHDFADGFNTYTLTSLYGNARRKAQTMLFADALAPVVGAASTLLFTLPEEPLGAYLGFFAGVLLYLAAAEILPEAHHRHPALSTLLCTVGGVAGIWLVVGLAD